jgi:hypothetical protein
MNVCIIEGSWGRVHVDAETGDVLRITDEPECAETEGYRYIRRFDLQEWKRFYKQETCCGADILDVGYWTKNDIYEPAVTNHREKIAQGTFSIICNESVGKLLKDGK